MDIGTENTLFLDKLEKHFECEAIGLNVYDEDQQGSYKRQKGKI